MSKSYKEIFNDITTLIFDVDGVFTDNTLILFPGVPPLRTMNVKDGYVIQLAVKKGHRIAIISGGTSEEVRVRMEGLGVKDVYLGAHDKIKVYEEYCAKYGLKDEEVLYMGDDIPDYPVLSRVGLSCCPADAAPDVKEVSKYVSSRNGGQGCVRDVVEQFLKIKGDWMSKEALQW